MESPVIDAKTTGFGSLQKLLDSYPCYTVGESTPPTLMQIAGFQHWEKGYSNILEFLLDSEQAHGFGTLFVQSILAAYKKQCPDGWPGKCLKLDIDLKTEKVEREATTATGKRIDLLVECSEFVVCIENKIWAGLHNDLGEYRKHCEQMPGGRLVLGIVLSPYKLDQDRRKILDNKFVNVTYSNFVEELQHRSGKYIDRYNTQYQYLLFDFMEQANRLERKKIMTDDEREFLKFWGDNDEKISNIQSNCDRLQQELIDTGLAQAHQDQCEEHLKRLLPSYEKIFKLWVYKRHVAVFDLADNGYIDQCSVFLDVVFHPLRVSQELGSRRGNAGPQTLASRVHEMCNIDFKPQKLADGKLSGRQVFIHQNTPFKEEVCTEAVETSVKILKALAEIRLEQDSASNSS